MAKNKKPSYEVIKNVRINTNTGNKLVTNKGKTNIRKEMIAQGKTDELKHKTGRKSYAEKAIRLNVYDKIAEGLYELKEENPFATQKDIRDYLVDRFPQVFKGCSKYSSNLMKAIEAEEPWKEALNYRGTEIKNAVLQKLYDRARNGVREEVDHNGNYYEIGMSDNSCMKFIQLLNELEDRNNKANTIDDDIPTFGFTKDE